MDWNHVEFEEKLKTTVETFDKPGAILLSDQLIAYLHKTDSIYPEVRAKRILQLLRNKCYFDLMQRAADAFLQSGQDSPQIRRQYAQSMIDQGNLTAALSAVEALVSTTVGNPDENAEARGLMGRIYKQLYVNAQDPGSQRNRRNLERAISAYYSVYSSDPSVHLWHGINAVALLSRGKRDGIPVDGFPDPEVIARDILATLKARELADALHSWDLAIGAEACVALDRSTEALGWIVKYVNRSETDAFELSSTLRQFTQLWNLEIASEPGVSLLPVLRSQLLDRKGGKVDMPSKELRGALESEDDTRLERILGTDGMETLQWYRNGLDRCRAVARVETESGQGFGTGFLVRGHDLHPAFGDELLLMTNAHVISDSPEATNVLRSNEAIITFEALETQPEPARKYRVVKILWSSPKNQLDATLARLDASVNLEPYPLAPNVPLADGMQRVYIIGHPGARTLSFSLHDNLFLDHEDPFLHYRTPTEGGSSGSPVFNKQWRLIGLHHAGGLSVRRLRGQPGTYAANEGIWIQSIIKQIAKDLESSQQARMGI